MNERGKGVVRVGVIGCGVIAYWVHLRLLQTLPGVELVVASDPDEGARERAKKIVRVPIVAESSEILSRADVDAVVICAPTGMHATLTVDSCKAGKHVFLEKPIATTAGDAELVMKAASAAGVSAFVGFNRRLHPMFEQARALIRRGEIGEVRAVQTAFCEPMPAQEMSAWRRRRDSGGGVLLDLASHHIDLLRWFLDDEIDTADADIHSDESEHDSATLSLSLSGGSIVQSFFSYRTARADVMEFIGEKATLRIDRHESAFTIKTNRRFGYGTRFRRVLPTPEVAAWRLKRFVKPSQEPSYRRALSAFADSIHGKPSRLAPSGLATFSDGARCLQVILSAEKSASTRTTVNASS